MWMMVNANGYRFDALNGRFDAVVIDGEKIVACGSRAELGLQYGARVNHVLDMGGATVLPGLVDSHLHVCGVGEQALKLNLVGVRSKSELLRRVADWSVQLGPEDWVLGGGWDDNRFTDGSLPSIAELNEAAGGRPLLLARICRHAYLANDRAFALAGVRADTPDPADGAYGRDASGQLNGMVYENACAPIQQAIPAFTRAQWLDALRQGMKQALAAGLTAVHTDDTRYVGGFAQTWSVYHALIHEHGVRLRVHELVDWTCIDECRAALADLPQPDAWLERGAAKLFSDGAMGGRTAWLLEPYSDSPGWSGTPMFTQEELDYRVRVAHEKGFAVAIHAIGDAGLDATLHAMEAAPAVSQRDRVVHAELVNPALIRRMTALGGQLAIDIQPRFTCSDFPWVAERVGSERARYVCAWQTLYSAGLHVCGGSDAPIEPIEPLLGIHAAVTRRLPFEAAEGYNTSEALSPVEAIRLFTQGACYANGSESVKGVIAPGWLADFTVLDRDIATPRDADDIRDAKVLYTIVGGEVAYAADGTQAG